MQIGIIHVKVDGLERSKQHWNMHRLSTCDRDRRVTDTERRHDDRISKVRRARADPFRAMRHAATCTLPPQCHSWATPPPRGTATCEMGLHRQPKGGSRHNRARPQPRTCTQCKRLQTCPCHPATLPSAPYLPPCRHPTGQTVHGRRISRAVGRHHVRGASNVEVDGVLRSALRSRRRRALTCGAERACQRGQEHMRGSDGV